ncbi:DUF6941 family protein [Halalkalibacterium ligniniphilum]|uniref:DUF6941 family protein n=1 Tax=Halalkalibacterium ligniniphilum TaxID=1134413 RepID=UPI00035F251A|nr:hypothetical protein [Halalkalibacterium ligniniphilum]
MWKIGYLILCEEIITTSDQKSIIPLVGLNPISIPGNFSFRIAFSLFSTDKNPSRHNIIRVVLKDPSGKTVKDTNEIKFEIPEPEITNGRAVKAGEADLGFNNIVLPVEGTYQVVVTVNGETKTLEVPVAKMTPLNEGDSVE